jgi:hypothetical protein
VENAVENLKRLDLTEFLLVEKYLLFQQRIFSFCFSTKERERFSTEKRPLRGISGALFFFPHFFSQFSLFHRASFQEFPQATGCPKFYTNRTKFSDGFPIEKTDP